MLADLRGLYDREHLFLISLPPLDAGMAEVGGEYLAAKQFCGESDHPLLDANVAEITRLRQEIGRMSAFVGESTSKRAILFSAMVAATKARIANGYAQVAGRELREMQAAIRAVLAAESLQRDINQWWQRSNVTLGLARGMPTRYLQHAKSVRALRSDLGQIDVWTAKVAGLTGTSREVRRVILDQLEDFKAKLTAELTRVEDLGWQGAFALQRELTGKRRAIADRFVAGCVPLLDAYDATAEAVVDQDGFAAAELLYEQQVNACVHGGDR
jgi:hypothetical protein